SRMRLLQQDRKSFRINLAHAAQMTSEMSFADELAKHKLFQKGCMPEGERHGRFEMRLQAGRNHHVSYAERGKQHIAETPSIQNQPMVIEPLQSWNRPSRITVLAVIIVFKNHRSCVFSPLQKL